MANVQRAVTAILWSLWTELGVPGVSREHRRDAIDPEALIVWTPHLAASDPRLIGLAFDWCALHAEWIVKARLPSLARQMPKQAAEHLAQFNGALARVGVPWRPAKAGGSLQRDRGKIHLPMERRSLVRFRLRALCGASTRAELLAALLAAGDGPVMVRDLMIEGVSRRSAERTLLDLAQGGLVVATDVARHRAYEIAQRASLEKMVDGKGLRWSRWHEVFGLAARLFELDRLRSHAKEGVRRVEAAQQWTGLTAVAKTLGLPAPPGPVEREDLLNALLVWGVETIERFAVSRPEGRPRSAAKPSPV